MWAVDSIQVDIIKTYLAAKYVIEYVTFHQVSTACLHQMKNESFALDAANNYDKAIIPFLHETVG